MNIIESHPVQELGYHFISGDFVPEGFDEYYLRNIQNDRGANYRNLTNSELETLVINRNTSDDWNNILVTDQFNPALVRNCKFYGLVRIGNLEPLFKEFHSFKIAVGLYNSTVISCDLGNNICLDNVTYLSHYIIGDDVIIANVNELTTTNYSKFGNGVVKEGEDENVRTWIEVCNENGGRSILPFNGMLAADAFLWSKYRDDKVLMQKFVNFTDQKFDNKRGYYGKIGDRTVIKNCAILKDVWIGTDAYLKGSNKIKNVTINSDADRKTQIGEGCEIVNGIIGFGCRIFYGVKAVRFFMSSHSQLKYGARLINSFLGNNSTISCCEVLNSLIFPSHEQHHNNSFLCAATVLGQSNMAAGATIGSNHNSRAADGEIVAGRGFWPGLCVSLKHNSRFASYTIIAKGDYPTEINIPIPFCLVSLDGETNQTVVMPAYWFMYNMYAMERNAWKIEDRDQRIERKQRIEYNYLAPDTINEIFGALNVLEALNVNAEGSAEVSDWEAGQRKTLLIKIPEAIKVFKELIVFYGATNLLGHIQENNITDFDVLKADLPAQLTRAEWENIGGQLVAKSEIKKLKKGIKAGTISSWEEIHAIYRTLGESYKRDKLQHAYTCLLEVLNITTKQFTFDHCIETFNQALKTKTWMCKGIYTSREKDYTNPFRKMVYDSEAEMNAVLGKLEDNSFIQQQLAQLDTMKILVKTCTENLKAGTGKALA